MEPAALVRGMTVPSARSPYLQGVMVGTVGIVLGIYTTTALSLPSQWAPLFILAVLCPFIVMIVGHVQRLLLAIIILDIPFPLDIHLGYRDDAANFGAVEGLNVSVTTISLIVLYALWLGELLSKQGPRPRLQLRENLPFVLYCAFTALSVLVAYDVTLSVFEIFLLLQMLLLYIYIASIVRTRQDVLFIVTMLLIGLVLESAIIIWVWLTGQHITIAA